jgi:hypothetical protein
MVIIVCTSKMAKIIFVDVEQFEEFIEKSNC